MKEDSLLKERVQLLEIGEVLGYPRLGYGRRNPSEMYGNPKRIPQGKEAWERFCAHAHATRIPAALRIAKTLRDYEVAKFHPLSGAEMPKPEPPPAPPVVVGPVDDLTAEIVEPYLSREVKKMYAKREWKKGEFKKRPKKAKP